MSGFKIHEDGSITEFNNTTRSELPDLTSACGRASAQESNIEPEQPQVIEGED